jgi:glycosyltransferase involved in cell wall biosynthesis
VATVYASLSEHEGFCVPLLEAMAFDVPVVAYDAGAVAETLDGAGVLLQDKSPSDIAALVHRLVRDTGLREAVLAGQRRRMDRQRAAGPGARLLRALEPVLELST